RVVCRRTGWAIIQAHPWLGIGPDALKTQFKKWIPPEIPRPLPDGYYEHLHNIYYQYAAERGVPTLLMMLWMLAKIAYDFVRALRKLPAHAEAATLEAQRVRREPPSEEGTASRRTAFCASILEARFVLHGSIAMLIGILIAGWYEVNLNDSEVLAGFLSVVACGYLAVESATAAQTPSSPHPTQS
ncbi:MAG: O-antigen ligase family protein, partial [Bryobacteraceae bacterium]